MILKNWNRNRTAAEYPLYMVQGGIFQAYRTYLQSLGTEMANVLILNGEMVPGVLMFEGYRVVEIPEWDMYDAETGNYNESTGHSNIQRALFTAPENLTGLARLVRMAVIPAMENVALWHERDISHSSVERAIGPDATVTLDFALHRLAGVVEKLVIYPGNMLANLNRFRGLVMSQRVLLARALAVEANVLLMDEPLANLDPPHQADWLRLVRQLVASGKTVVSVLHEISSALAADDVLVLQQGRVQHCGPSGDAATHQTLEAVFEHRIAIHRLMDQWVSLPKLN
jgi:ABC-type arginine transport system ATPase subunit